MHTDAVANVFMTLPTMKTKGGQMEIIKLKTGKCCCLLLLLLLLLLLVPRAVHIKLSDTLQKNNETKHRQKTKTTTARTTARATRRREQGGQS